MPARRRPGQVQGQSRHVVGYLRDFLFRDEQARQPVKALSGGERNRLLLAKILAQPCNLLILDEPTNDLDIETLDLLEEMLADYAGTLLLVSHDRDFLDRLVTSTIVFEGSRTALGNMPEATATGCASGPPRPPRDPSRMPTCAALPPEPRATRVFRPSCSASSTGCRTGLPRSKTRSQRSRRRWPIPDSTPAIRSAFAGASERLSACAHRLASARGAMARAGDATRGRALLIRSSGSLRTVGHRSLAARVVAGEGFTVASVSRTGM